MYTKRLIITLFLESILLTNLYLLTHKQLIYCMEQPQHQANKPRTLRKHPQESKLLRNTYQHLFDKATNISIDKSIGKQVVNYFYTPLQLIFLSGEYQWKTILQYPGYQSPLLMLAYTCQNIQDLRTIYCKDGQRSSHSHTNRVLSQICQNDWSISNQMKNFKLFLTTVMSKVFSAFPIAYFIFGNEKEIPDKILDQINKIIHPWDKLYPTFEQNVQKYAEKFVNLFIEYNEGMEEQKIKKFRQNIIHILGNQYKNYGKDKKKNKERQKFQTNSGRWIRRIQTKENVYQPSETKYLYYWVRIVQILKSIIPQLFNPIKQIQNGQKLQSNLINWNNPQHIKSDQYQSFESLDFLLTQNTVRQQKQNINEKQKQSRISANQWNAQNQQRYKKWLNDMSPSHDEQNVQDYQNNQSVRQVQKQKIIKKQVKKPNLIKHNESFNQHQLQVKSDLGSIQSSNNIKSNYSKGQKTNPFNSKKETRKQQKRVQINQRIMAYDNDQLSYLVEQEQFKKDQLYEYEESVPLRQYNSYDSCSSENKSLFFPQRDYF